MNTASKAFAVFVALAAAIVSGCQTSPATMDLITAARKGLVLAKEAQVQQHELQLQLIQQQASSLDSAFDADVQLATSGGIKTPDGQPVALTSEWVISARKGYAAARDVMARQQLDEQAAHAQRMDNIQASDESLDMAQQLIVQQYNVEQNIMQRLLAAQRSLINGK